jgi:hypothetical protein
MLLDKHNLFFDQTSIAVAAGPVTSDSIDLGANASRRKIPLTFFAQITEAVASGGASTSQIILEGGSDNLTFGTTYYDSTALAKTTFTLGFNVAYDLPETTKLARYLRMRVVVATATQTAGKITAGLIPDGGRQTNGV